MAVYNENYDCVDFAYTDENGNYTIDGLPPGNYKVFFDPWNHNIIYGTDFLSEWCDNKPDFDSADIVSVTSGQNTSGINARISDNISTVHPRLKPHRNSY